MEIITPPTNKQISTDKLFLSYMHLISTRESQEIYRIIEPVGSGIMRHCHIDKGIESVYSEMEYYMPAYQTDRKNFDVLEIMYIAEGNAEFELMNRQFVSGTKGDIMIFNSQSASRRCILGKNGLSGLSLIVFPEDTVETMNRTLGTNKFTTDNFFNEIRKSDSVVTFPADEVLEILFKEMIKFHGEYSTFHIKLSALQALLILMTKKDRRDHSDFYFSGATGKKVQNARKIITDSIDTDISIEKLSRQTGVNRTTLQKVFKEMYGVTINEYRTQIRIQEAKNLLITTSLSVTEIAGRCGYSNASKFSSTFKRYTGTLPHEWRKQTF